MPFFPLIKTPSSASRYSCTCEKANLLLLLKKPYPKWLNDCVSTAENAYEPVYLVALPELDHQQKYHPGWGKSKTQATHTRYSQIASAQQDHNAAEMDPSEKDQELT